MKNSWLLNTSNPDKLKEFQKLFSKRGCLLSSTCIDLKEIHSDPVSVVLHKAGQMDEEVLVDDTSLDIENAEVGINVKWLYNHLTTYIDRKAMVRILLAYRKQDLVYVYEGKTEGVIVPPRGSNCFGFDPIFLPLGETKTLAEAKPPEVDSRAKAVNLIFEEKPTYILPPILYWDGPWQ